MPRLPKNYANTIIYKVVCNDLSITDIYVGHTTNFTVRKTTHKNNCRNEKGKEYNTKVYTTIRANGGWENYTMVEVQKYPCKDATEARIKEREWFETLQARLNTISPQRSLSNEEYYFANRERILTRVHSYADSHKPEISERGKSYKKKHKEEIRERRAKTFMCECGKETTFDHKSRHLRTLFHQQFITDSPSPEP
jgi:hypothetical protein